ncbi:MAG: hypothetical protein HRU04_19985 [Oceanospirillaceae bacterium]|nr:hypothetical protein [Oceanospirillaceae bacterium]
MSQTTVLTSALSADNSAIKIRVMIVANTNPKIPQPNPDIGPALIHRYTVAKVRKK